MPRVTIPLLMPRRELFLLPLLCGGSLLAQTAKWSAAVPAPPQKGLHAITLSAELLGCSRADLGDIRLFDSTGAQVPYVIEQVRSTAAHGAFHPFSVVRNEVLDRSTIIEFERPADGAVETLHIRIRPLDAEKKVRVTGSDDRKAWYMVKDEHVVAQGARGDPPHQVLILDLPRSDYRYFRLTLNDSLTAPMRVLGVGRFGEATAASPRFLDAGAMAFTQRDSARTSVISVRSARPVLVERLAYKVSDTVRYRRDARILRWRWGTMRKGLQEVRSRSAEEVARTGIASDRASLIEVPSARLDTFEVRIDNGDDRPLRFAELWPQVVHRVMLAELRPGMRYRLSTGDPSLAPPAYDMAHFADQLAEPVDTLVHDPLRASQPEDVEASAFDPAKWWIWVAIVALVLGMGWMASRMLLKS